MIATTNALKRVRERAELEAGRFHDTQTDARHYLLALVNETTGAAAVALRDQGLDLEKVRESIATNDPTKFTAQFEFQEGLFEQLMELQERLKHKVVGTAHFLLSLIEETDGEVATLLRCQGIDLHALRRKLSAGAEESTAAEGSFERSRRPAADWLQAIEDPNPHVRLEVVARLAQAGQRDILDPQDAVDVAEFPQTADVVVALTRVLDDPDVNIRVIAANGLGTLRNNAKQAIPSLLKRLNDVQCVRDSVACALVRAWRT